MRNYLEHGNLVRLLWMCISWKAFGFSTQNAQPQPANCTIEANK